MKIIFAVLLASFSLQTSFAQAPAAPSSTQQVDIKALVKTASANLQDILRAASSAIPNDQLDACNMMGRFSGKTSMLLSLLQTTSLFDIENQISTIVADSTGLDSACSDQSIAVKNYTLPTTFSSDLQKIQGEVTALQALVTN